MAALTAAFAFGQTAGPLLVGLGGATGGALAASSGMAAALLLLAAAMLRLTESREPQIAAR
jgi:hypothetical protein